MGERRHFDALKELHRSYLDIQVEFEDAGLSGAAGHAWINHVLRYIVSSPDVYPDAPDIPQPEPAPFTLNMPFLMYEIKTYDKQPYGVTTRQLAPGLWARTLLRCMMNHSG